MDRDFNKTDGKWFPVMNELADKLITCDLTKIEHRALWMFFRYCYGYQKSTCELQWKEMKDITGFADGTLSRALNRLKSRNILHTFQMESKTYVTYKINSKLSTWKTRLSKRKDFPNGIKIHSKRKVNTFHTESTPIKDNIKTNKDNTPKSSKIEIPDWIDLEVWREFKKYRKAKFTPYAQKLAVNKLAKLRDGGDDPNLVIQQTILRGWSGLFPLKEDFNKTETTEEWIKRVSQ